MRIVVALLSCFLLISCIAQSPIKYGTSPEQRVYYNNKLFLLRENKESSSAFVTEARGWGPAKAVAEGLTMNRLNLTAPLDQYKDIVEKHLDHTKRNCKILRSSKLKDYKFSGYEFFFECEN